MRKETVENCTLYLADCLDVLEELGTVDAVVTDPPYGIDFDCSKKRTRKSAMSMGSGTTGVACIKHGLQFIGVEADEEHFETALERIQKESR